MGSVNQLTLGPIFRAHSGSTALLTYQIFFHAEEVPLAGTLNDPQQLFH
jgi:hypothetical protein